MTCAFSWPVRVYWEDTDGGGIVYYANYLRFLERARTEWLRAARHRAERAGARAGAAVRRRFGQGRLSQPARLDDLLASAALAERDGAATLDFRQDIRRGSADGELLVAGTARVACLDAATLRPRRLPAVILEVLKP